jgi:ABC-type transport system involved in cytochrome bd biosynthesis fused ATPase/permease subunit
MNLFRRASWRSPGPLLRLTPLVKAHLPLLGLSLLLRTLNLAAGIVLLGLSGAWIARAVHQGTAPSRSELIALAVVGIVKAGARYGEQVFGHAAAFRILETLRNAIFAGFARRGIAVNAADRSGDLVSRAMGDVELVEVYFAHTLAPVASAFLFVATAGLVVGLTAGPLVEVVVLTLLVAAAVLIPHGFQLAGERLGREGRTQGGALSAEVAEGIAGVQDLLVAGAEQRWADRIEAAGESATRAIRRLGVQSALKDVLVDACLVACLLVVVGAAAGGSVDVGRRVILWGVACGLAGGFGAVLSVSRAVDDLPRSAAAALRVLDIVNAPPGAEPGGIPLSGEAAPAIVLDGVTVRHAPGRGVFDVHLHVEPGEHLFVTGPSGSGKSTLTAAILGLVRPDAGVVRFGDVPLDRVDRRTLRDVLAASGQAFRLVPGTVAENIALGARDGTAVSAAARTIPDVTSLVAELSEGEATRLNGADEQLSGGQQRRIGLARLIARDPRVLVLDEAFAGLDAALRGPIRRRVLAWAREGGRTVVEISHETMDARDADRVVVLVDGRLVEDGTHDRLVAAGGAFASLVGSQAGLEQVTAAPNTP